MTTETPLSELHEHADFPSVPDGDRSAASEEDEISLLDLLSFARYFLVNSGAERKNAERQRQSLNIKTADVDAAARAIEADGGAIIRGPYDDAHERRAVVYDHKGNGLVFYSPLARK